MGIRGIRGLTPLDRHRRLRAAIAKLGAASADLGAASAEPEAADAGLPPVRGWFRCSPVHRTASRIARGVAAWRTTRCSNRSAAAPASRSALALAQGAPAGLAWASQPTPPITIAVTEESSGKADAVIAVITITANEEVAQAVLTLSAAKEGLRLGTVERQESATSLRGRHLRLWA